MPGNNSVNLTNYTRGSLIQNISDKLRTNTQSLWYTIYGFVNIVDFDYLISDIVTNHAMLFTILNEWKLFNGVILLILLFFYYAIEF